MDGSMKDCIFTPQKYPRYLDALGSIWEMPEDEAAYFPNLRRKLATGAYRDESGLIVEPGKVRNMITALEIAQAIGTDRKRIIVDEFSDFIGIRVSRYSDDRWKGWRLPVGAICLPGITATAMKEWLDG